jgi:hypothetical protein
MLRLANKALPAGVAWDTDEDIPGVLTRSVEADPLRGERCPICGRAYQGEEEEADPDQLPCAVGLDVLRRLIEAAWEHPDGCDLRLGRQVVLLALYLGMLPECSREAELAKLLGVDPAALSRSKLLLPAELQALCHLHHRPRKTALPAIRELGPKP